jgi:hypothetical protein
MNIDKSFVEIIKEKDSRIKELEIWIESFRRYLSNHDSGKELQKQAEKLLNIK